MKRFTLAGFVLLAVLGVSVWSLPVTFAGEHGGKEHGGSAPSAKEHGGSEHGGSHAAGSHSATGTVSDAEVLFEAAAALKSSHPELAAKLKSMAKKS